MKKLILVVLYLFVTGCGTFNLRVQIVPPTVETVPTLRASSTPTARLTATPLIVSPTPTSTPEQPFTLVALQMSDTDHGWGVDPLGRIVTTSNGGVVWADVTPSEEPFGRHSLFTFSDKVAWVVSSQFENSHLVWRTLDGGISWRASQPIPLSSGSYIPVRLQFPDADHGWMLLLAQDENQGSRMLLLSSDDGGEGWSQVTTIQESLTLSYLPPNTTSMAFVDGQRGWLGGAWEQGNPAEWLMLKTGDGGEIWGTDTFRLPAQKDIQCDGQAIAEMRPGAMAVEVICTIPRDAKYLFHHIYYLSDSTGPEWHSWAISGAFLGMDFLNPNQGWMMVASDDPQANRILNTRDGGKTWKVISKVAWKQAQFDFITDKIGWAIVGDGFATALYRTEDTGKTWIQVRPSLAP